MIYRTRIVCIQKPETMGDNGKIVNKRRDSTCLKLKILRVFRETDCSLS